MRYEARGRVPAKRHVALRENGTLLTEEVMGFEGFSGNESILYHCRRRHCDRTGAFRADQARGVGRKHDTICSTCAA